MARAHACALACGAPQTLEDVTPSWFVLDHGEQVRQQTEAAAESAAERAKRARTTERRAKAEREEMLANADGAEGPPTQPRRKLQPLNNVKR